MKDPSKVITALSHAGYEFLISDLELALTFTRIAAHAREDGDKRIRNIQNARRAYNNIRELAPRLVLTGEQQQRVTETLTTLKSALERIGQDAQRPAGFPRRSNSARSVPPPPPL